MIEYFFNQGYKYKEIITFLNLHHNLDIRQLVSIYFTKQIYFVFMTDQMICSFCYRLVSVYQFFSLPVAFALLPLLTPSIVTQSKKGRDGTQKKTGALWIKDNMVPDTLVKQPLLSIKCSSRSYYLEKTYA